ncbi:MAG: hypothetical protein B6245_12970, partial [Desulfobacteraceae bacterium 4572_88]
RREKKKKILTAEHMGKEYVPWPEARLTVSRAVKKPELTLLWEELDSHGVKTVLPYYEKFLHHFPGLEDLAGANLQDVLKLWEGLGYYARARNLHRAAKLVLEEYEGQIPSDWNLN